MLPCGFTYLDGNDEEGDYHLHIISSKPDNTGLVVVLSVSTMYRFADKTVILGPDEHPWLKHQSFVAYSFAKLQQLNEIKARLDKLPRMVKPMLLPQVLQKVQDGILESEQTENGVKHFYREVSGSDTSC